MEKWRIINGNFLPRTNCLLHEHQVSRFRHWHWDWPNCPAHCPHGPISCSPINPSPGSPSKPHAPQSPCHWSRRSAAVAGRTRRRARSIPRTGRCSANFADVESSSSPRAPWLPSNCGHCARLELAHPWWEFDWRIGDRLRICRRRKRTTRRVANRWRKNRHPIPGVGWLAGGFLRSLRSGSRECRCSIWNPSKIDLENFLVRILDAK